MKNTTMVMVAPNGARKTHRDHDNIPLSIEATVTEAKHCHAVGASILHAHVRGDQGEHVLDGGLYRELIAEMDRQVPNMLVQITSEAVGRYSPEEQAAVIREVKPRMASMGLREITEQFADTRIAREFFAWCEENEVHIQHILFSANDLERFLEYRAQGVVPETQRCLMLVLGRYSADLESSPTDLEPFLQYDLNEFDWFTCAFGKREQECVLQAIAKGGHARIGFENNLYLPDGKLAESSAALVASLVEKIRNSGLNPASSDQASARLGVRNA